MSDLEPPDIAPEPPTRRRDRRTWLKEVGAAGAGAMIAGTAASQPASSGAILPRTSTSGVYVPPRGRGFMKFSFDCPEPSVAFEGFEFSFRVFTQENTYSLAADHLAVRASDNGLEIRCDELTWAGGQQRAPGRVTARLTRRGDAVECEADVEMERPDQSRGDDPARRAARTAVGRPGRRFSIRATTRCCSAIRSRAAISSALRAMAA